MKKVFLNFMTVLALTTAFYSCESDDDTAEVVENETGVEGEGDGAAIDEPIDTGVIVID